MGLNGSKELHFRLVLVFRGKEFVVEIPESNPRAFKITPKDQGQIDPSILNAFTAFVWNFIDESVFVEESITPPKQNQLEDQKGK